MCFNSLVLGCHQGPVIGVEGMMQIWSSVAHAHTQSLFPGHRVWTAHLRTWGPVTLSRTQAPYATHRCCGSHCCRWHCCGSRCCRCHCCRSHCCGITVEVFVKTEQHAVMEALLQESLLSMLQVIGLHSHRYWERPSALSLAW